MSLGKRNILLEIEHKTAERSDVNNTKAEWGTFTKLWCEAITQGSGEPIEGGRQLAETTYTFKTHWTPKAGQVTADMRAKLPSGQLLGIRSAVNENLENKTLVLTCIEQS